MQLYKVLLFSIALSFSGCGDKAPQSDRSTSPKSEAYQPAFTALLNSSPNFENQGTWSEGYLKAIGHGSGVVVGPGSNNPNVFAQLFSAKPGEQFKVIAKASSAEKPTGMGRIQINWSDAEGKFLSVSSQAFEVGTEEKTYELIVTAPSGVVDGVIYVVADGSDSVVRYTEMRLMGNDTLYKATAISTNPTVSKRIQEIHNGGYEINAYPKLENMTPLDGSGKVLSLYEMQYYFYHAVKAMKKRANLRGSDFIFFVMPDSNINKLMPAIKQLRSEGIKVIAYEPTQQYPTGVDDQWFWQKTDSHWSEASVRMIADEILRVMSSDSVLDQSFSLDYLTKYPNDNAIKK